MSDAQSTDARPAMPLAPAPAPADVGIVAALPMEVGPLVDRLERVRTIGGPRLRVTEGEIGSKLIAVITPGPGKTAAQRGTQLLIDGHRPNWVFSIGFAGALDPALARNTVLAASEVRDDAGKRWSTNVGLVSEPPLPRVQNGVLVTVRHIVRTAKEKAVLRAQTGADAVDMETAAVAEVCAARGVPMLAFRVVSDEADYDLPPEVLSIFGSTGSYRLGAALGAVWRRPSSIKDLWNLHLRALEAADRLADVVAAALERLP
jgi:adenosylhomocysteine nucleosidase